MTLERLFLTRTLMLGGTGVLCAVYAMLALAMGRPDPLPIWLTAVAGALAWGVIRTAANAAGADVARQSFDEGYDADCARAQSFGFWTALWMYPVFGGLLWLGWIDWAVALASMGCLTAASFLLRLIWLDVRGRSAC